MAGISGALQTNPIIN